MGKAKIERNSDGTLKFIEIMPKPPESRQYQDPDPNAGRAGEAMKVEGKVDAYGRIMTERYEALLRGDKPVSLARGVAEGVMDMIRKQGGISPADIRQNPGSMTMNEVIDHMLKGREGLQNNVFTAEQSEGKRLADALDKTVSNAMPAQAMWRLPGA